MTYNDAIKELEDIRDIVRMYGDPENAKSFILDQEVDVRLCGCYGRKLFEIWKVKGEVRMRINPLSENIYYAQCAVISVSIYSQLKLDL
jgi:hypothetical protein